MNAKMSLFGIVPLDFLGHYIKSSSITLLLELLAAIKNHPAPQNGLQMINFLGTINFYCCFVPAAARTLKPLKDVLKGASSKRAPISWTWEMGKAFKTASKALGVVTTLAHPQKKKQSCPSWWTPPKSMLALPSNGEPS